MVPPIFTSYRSILVLFIILLTAQLASAQDTSKIEINIDLSDETEETEVVKKGYIQYEHGLLINGYKSSSTSVISQSLLRYGLTDRLEVRAIAEEGKNRDHYISETVQSTFPLAVGAKAALLKDKGAFPDVSLLAYLNLPITAKSSENSRYWSPMFLLAFQNEMADWKIDYNIASQQEAFSSQWAYMANAAIHYSWNDKLETYLEYYSQFQPAEYPSHNLGIGSSFQFSNSFAAYITGGSTIFTRETNSFINLGLAVLMH